MLPAAGGAGKFGQRLQSVKLEGAQRREHLFELRDPAPLMSRLSLLRPDFHRRPTHVF